MESYTLALSPSTLFLGSSKLPNRNPKPKFSFTLRSYSFSKSLYVSCLRRSSSPCSSSNFEGRSYISLLVSSKITNGFVVRAASVSGNTDETTESQNLVRTLQLGSMFAIWYFLNISYNICNKQVLKVFPFPATVTAFQFGCGTVLVLLMWAFNLYPKPKITKSQIATILSLAVIHTMGNILTNISIGKVAVSFTHTIKSMEPFFTVVLATLFLGEKPSLWVVASLVPIVGGVALTSFTEASLIG